MSHGLKNMQAIIKNDLHDTILGLKLVRVGTLLSWADVDTGELHGALFQDWKQARTWLIRYYSRQPGTEIAFRRENGSSFLTLIEAAA